MAKLTGKDNAWIKPSGQFIEVGYMQHSNWAWDYLREKLGEDYIDKIEEKVGFGEGAMEYLFNLGWVRLMTWRDNDHNVVSDVINPRLTEKQKQTLAEWRLDNNNKDVMGFNVEDK